MGTRRLRVGAVLAALAVGIVCFTGTAGAHGPEATFTPITQEPVAGELALDLRVTLIYDDDADPVDDATVQVTPVDGSGAEGAQATLARAPEPGTYEGTVPVTAPGEWTFKLTSADPEAALELPIQIPEPAPATVAPTPAPSTSAAAKAPAVATSLPGGATEDTEAAVVADEPAPVEDSDEGTFPWGIAVLVAVVAAGVAMAMAYAMRSRSDEEIDDDPAGPVPDDPTDGGSAGPVA